MYYFTSIILLVIFLITILLPILYLYFHEDIPFTSEWKQKKIKLKVEKIYKILEIDFLTCISNKDLWINKVSCNNNIFYYKLDDDSIFSFKYKDKIIYLNYKVDNKEFRYKISNKDLVNKIIKLSNEIIDYSVWLIDIKKRAERKYYEQKEAPKPKHSDHPKWAIYQTLVKTVNSRKQHLKSMSKNDPNRQTLENELIAAESRMKLLKQKYGF
jgi:hypothetical protein